MDNIEKEVAIINLLNKEKNLVESHNRLLEVYKNSSIGSKEDVEIDIKETQKELTKIREKIKYRLRYIMEE